MRLDYAPGDSCPCGGGARASACCWKSAGVWLKDPSAILPRPPRSGYAHPKCYAQSTNDCSPKISKEHYISRGLLALYGLNGLSLVAGLPHISGQAFATRPTASLVANVLCERHNNSLSPLDGEVRKLALAIGNYDADFNAPAPVSQIRVFSGEDVERWMLKTVCGMVSSGQVAFGRVVESRQMAQVWVDVLYGACPWPEGWGLYFGGSDRMYHSSSFSFLPMSQPASGRVMAADLEINGMRFRLALGKPDDPARFGTFRPRSLIFEQDGVKKYIELSWQDQNLQQLALLSRTGIYQGPPPDWPQWARELSPPPDPAA